MPKPWHYILLVILLWPVSELVGQVSSPLGRYQVDYVKGCAPLTVTITDLTGGPTAQYLYDADTCVMSSPKYNPALCPPTNTSTSTTYTYQQPGTYSLVQVVASQVPRGDTIQIEVLPPQAPDFNLTLCNNFGVSVNITDMHYDQFMIDYGDGSPPTQMRTHSYTGGGNYAISVSGFFNNGPINCGDSSAMLTPVATLPAAVFNQVEVTNQARINGSSDLSFTLNPNVVYELQGTANSTSSFQPITNITGNTYSHSGINVNTVDSIYCFRIAALDPCGGNAVYSDTLCTTRLEVLTQAGQNQVNWFTFVTNDFRQYEITRNGQPLGAPITSPSITGTLDTDVECDVSYCYQAITVNNRGGRSLSIESCVTGVNSLPPPKIENLTASVDGASVVLDWQPGGTVSSYQVFRSVNGEPFEKIADPNAIPFIDINLRPQVNDYCYYITYTNTCGLESEPSVTGCAIRLTGANNDNQSIDLNWTNFSGWQSGILDYELEILDETGALVGPPISLGSTSNSYSDPITGARQISQYRIVAVSRDPVPFRSYSNIHKEDIPLQVFVPNSFTPNNDGLNDTFRAKGLFIENYSMEIYSRWGNLMFHTDDLEKGWDGFYRGTLSPQGTYVYKIKATDPRGRSVLNQGTVHLLRKGD